jgi:hypothetical protein
MIQFLLTVEKLESQGQTIVEVVLEQLSQCTFEQKSSQMGTF